MAPVGLPVRDLRTGSLEEFPTIGQAVAIRVRRVLPRAQGQLGRRTEPVTIRIVGIGSGPTELEPVEDQSAPVHRPESEPVASQLEFEMVPSGLEERAAGVPLGEPVEDDAAAAAGRLASLRVAG